MFRRHALAGVSGLALQVLLLAPATTAKANHHLPEITVDAPAVARHAANKPASRPAQTRRQARRPATAAPPQRRPVLVVNAQGSGPGVPGTPPEKQRYQLPQTS